MSKGLTAKELADALGKPTDSTGPVKIKAIEASTGHTVEYYAESCSDGVILAAKDKPGTHG